MIPIPYARLVPWAAGAIAAMVLFGLGVRTGTHWADGRVARAEQALAAYKGAIAEAEAKAAQRQVAIRDDVRGYYDDQRATISGLSNDVRRLSAGVRLCEQASTYVLSRAAEGADAAAAGGQPRPATDVLAELATSLAETADRNAAQLNALISWLEQTSAATTSAR